MNQTLDLPVVASKARSSTAEKRLPFRLAFIDLDDTLLGPDKGISADNLEALDRLSSAGIEVVIASGRHHASIVGFAERIGRQGWVLSSQGAVVRHTVTQEVLHEQTLTPGLALENYRRALRENVAVIGYHREGVFVERESEWTRLYEKRAGWRIRRGDLQSLALSGLEKLLWSAPAERIQALRPDVDRAFGERFYVVQTEEEVIEFLSPKANKALGARVVARELGIPREAVLAFGDGNNDIELLEWAGMSVAMSHGREGAKRAAHRVSPPGPPDTAFARAVDTVFSA